jgi:hypothetical protein
MDRKFALALPIVPMIVTLVAAAQLPLPGAQSQSTVETSRISRFLAGPGDRPQGFLLRNGTLVMLPPGLGQQLPATMNKNTTVRVSGDELLYDGNKTIQARSISVNGVDYNDVGPATVPPRPAPGPAAAPPGPPPPPAPGRPGPGPGGAMPPPLPPPPGPCAVAVPPPPAPVNGGAGVPATPLAPQEPAPPGTTPPADTPPPPPQN